MIERKWFEAQRARCVFYNLTPSGKTTAMVPLRRNADHVLERSESSSELRQIGGMVPAGVPVAVTREENLGLYLREAIHDRLPAHGRRSAGKDCPARGAGQEDHHALNAVRQIGCDPISRNDTHGIECGGATAHLFA